MPEDRETAHPHPPSAKSDPAAKNSRTELHPPVHAPDIMTEPCSRFFRWHYQLWGFFFFIIATVTKTDEVARTAAKALYDYYEQDEGKKAQFKQIIEGGGGAVEALRSYREVLLQMTFSRGADNYLTYVAELLALIFISRPETLRSSETMRLDFVLGHSSFEDLIDALAERRVERLSYQSMRDLASDLSEKLDFGLYSSTEELDRIVRIVETRNLTVHNRAVVNRRYLQKLPDCSAKVVPSSIDTQA
jgi:hypothetical protein